MDDEDKPQDGLRYRPRLIRFTEVYTFGLSVEWQVNCFKEVLLQSTKR